MTRYQGRHELPSRSPRTHRSDTRSPDLTPRSTRGHRLPARPVVASAGAMALVLGAVGYAAARDLGPVATSAAPVSAMAFTSAHGDHADLLDYRVDASRTSNLASSAQTDAKTKAAADAAAAAATDAAAAEAARAAEADRAARDAERQAVLANAKSDPKSVAQAMFADFGFADSQFSCLSSLWTRESNWTYTATNKSSGAYGIPQSLPGSKMASAGADYRTNPATQIKWGLGYIKSTYGTPCGAWAHSQATGWY